MSKNIITDFKDLRDAIEEVRKSQPAQTRYELQAEKMGYMQEAEAKPEDDKDDKKDSFDSREDHAGEEEIIKGYKALGDKALVGSVEYRRKLLQKELAKMGYKTYSKAAFDDIFKFESTQLESALSDMQDIVKNKSAKKIGGVMVDMFTASVITKAYDQVNDANKKKLEKANLQTLVKLAHKLMGMKEELELDESKMGDLLIDIQQGATAKELAKDYSIPLSVAKNFLKDYYGQKKGSRREDVQEGMKLKDVMRKHGRELKKVSRSNNLELSKKAEDDLMTWAMDSGEIRTDDPDEFDQWLDNNLDDLVKGKIKEGKYLKYSDLLLKKSRLIDKEGPNSPTVKAINKEIGKEMKKLGIHEENLQEGTWAIPDSYKKLYNIQVGFLEMKKAATKSNAKRMAKDLYNLFGDDALFDDLLRVETGEDTETKDLRDILKKHLEPFGIKIKAQGARYQITHAPQKWVDNMTAEPADESVDETAKKRKAGNKKTTGHGAKKKVVFKTDKQDKLVSLRVSKEDKLKEEQQHAKQSPFKLKSQQYPRAIAIDTTGYGKRHATVQDIIDACDSFGMITDQELQVEQIQKQLGKQGFISYKSVELQDVFEDRETQRMIYALESLTEEQKPVEYYRDEIEDAFIMSEEIEFLKPDGQKTAGKILKLCENTFNVKDKYTGKSFTYKYIKEEGVNKVRTFKEITTITEGRFSKKLIRMAGGIAFDKRYVGGNMSGAVKAIEKLKKGLSDDPEVSKMLRLANESFNNEFYNSMSEEEKTEYQKFFMKALKKFGVSSPTELDDAKKKEFFDYIEKNWTKDESKEAKVKTATELRLDGRRKNFREKMRKLGYIKGPR